MRKKIAVLHPSFGWGGAESACVRLIEALKDRFDIDLFVTGENIGISGINSYYGADFKKNDFNIVSLNYPVKGYILHSHLLQRYFKARSHNYGLVIATHHEMDFGTAGLQFIHDPVMIEQEGRRPGILKKIYHGICFRISGYDEKRMKNNLTIANSRWAAEEIRKIYGIDAEVVYPPVETDFPPVMPRDKKDEFVCVGRISPSKKLENIISILRDVRKEYPSIRLSIIGHIEGRGYYEKINGLARENAGWISVHTGLPRNKVKEHVSGCKFGIHGMAEEPFGIAVAEMVAAGCMVFVPNGGGQSEIVNDSRLIYSGRADAVSKIKQVLGNDLLQKEILLGLGRQSEKFSVEEFKKRIMQLIEDYGSRRRLLN